MLDDDLCFLNCSLRRVKTAVGCARPFEAGALPEGAATLEVLFSWIGTLPDEAATLEVLLSWTGTLVDEAATLKVLLSWIGALPDGATIFETAGAAETGAWGWPSVICQITGGAEIGA